jgi:hypothetical protein
LSHALELLRKQLGLELDARFKAAEWEVPVKTALEALYPAATVRWVAGSNEHGADVIVQVEDVFGSRPWLIIVQVKNYVGEIGAEVLNQLRTAYARYSLEGKILCLVVMTTAEKLSPGVSEATKSLEGELTVPVHFVLRKQMLEILSNGLVPGVNGSETHNEADGLVVLDAKESVRAVA